MHQTDRVAVIPGDGAAAVGPAEQVFESPRDERTTKFVSGELVH